MRALILLTWPFVLLFIFVVILRADAAEPAGREVGGKKYPLTLADSLPFEGEFVEVTEAGTLRRRYRAWGSYEKEFAAWKAVVDKSGVMPSRTFRLGCIFLKDAQIEFSDVPGADGKPLHGTFSTPAKFSEEMQATTAPAFNDFAHAFTGGAVKSEWVFETLTDLKWTATGKHTGWGCQPRAIAEQVEAKLAKYKDANIDMWVFCAGKPVTTNGKPKQNIGGPPYGISYTQWQLHDGYCSAIWCCRRVRWARRSSRRR